MLLITTWILRFTQSVHTNTGWFHFRVSQNLRVSNMKLPSYEAVNVTPDYPQKGFCKKMTHDTGSMGIKKVLQFLPIYAHNQTHPIALPNLTTSLLNAMGYMVTRKVKWPVQEKINSTTRHWTIVHI